eukprot:TRINITY_DN5681_c0_g1_i2.p1 TRINITY_DN5681_c0_g1~~TRINITY_DN5681_c0_g1_i2.p1  ORF type:complete len:452 (-),score=113.66 TRINITY_DN5681_c0_g1_i2:246-1601(-)
MGATYSLNMRSESPVLQRPVRANDTLVINPLLNEDRLILRDIPELSTLLPFPFGRLNAPPAQLHSTTTVRCVVNLHKDSLQLLHEKIQKEEPTTTPIIEQNDTNETNENTSLTNETNSTNEKTATPPTPADFLHTLRFNFDSTEPCQIRVYLLASENTTETTSTPTLTFKAESGPVSFPAGLEQTFSLPLVGPLSLTSYKPEELSNMLPGGLIPVLISLKSSVVDSDKKLEENITTKDKDSKDKDKLQNQPNRVVRHQLTYATLIFCTDGTYAIKVFRQKVHFGGSVFGVHDIFGIDNNDGGENRECVVCMTEPRDTIVLPCRHCCLCGACAEMMRFQTNKCAICRSAVKSFLKVSLSSKQDDSNTQADNNSQLKTSTNNFITQPPIPTPSSLNYNSNSGDESTAQEDESIENSPPKMNKITSGYSKLEQLDEEDEEEELILNKKEKGRKN